MACLCCTGHTTDGREMTLGIRREVVYCGRSGELKDGGPVFIYKYPYSCVLSCKLCRNWQEQGCVFGFKRGSKYNLKDSSAAEMSHEWVPYVWSCGYGSRRHSYQCSESAVNHSRCRNDLSSQSKVRRSCHESELLSCKECDTERSDIEVSPNLDR